MGVSGKLVGRSTEKTILLQGSVLRLLRLALDLLNLLLAQEQERLDLLGQAVLGRHALRDPLAADQTRDDAGSDNERQHEPVHAVPVRSPAARRRTCVVIVQESERQELRDQSVLDGEQQRRPRHRRRDATSRISAEPMLSTISCPLQTPVDSTQERQNLGSP